MIRVKLTDILFKNIRHNKFSEERADYCTLAGTILCIAGVITISWNGASLSVFLDSGGITMAALVLAGIGAAGFSISQKARIRSADMLSWEPSFS